MGWYFIPWTLQYLIGGVLVLLLITYVYYKNPKSLSTLSFFLFGLCTVLWEFFAFLHRNSPSTDLSIKFLGLDFLFALMVPASLLLTIIYLREKKPVYFLSILPALVVGCIIIILTPFDVVWSNFGWTYTTTPLYFMLTFPVTILYVTITIVTTVLLIKKAPISVLRKKYIVILFSFIIFYVCGVILSNILLQNFPNFPPLGGFFVALTFLCIAYAILLPTEKIEVLHTRNMKKFSKDYFLFLNKLLEETPGKELGENVIRFKDHLQNLGLRDVIVFERGKISFRPEPKLDLGEVTDKSLDFMKQRGWALSAVKPFTDVFVDTYEAMKSKSKKDADEWFERMLRKHGVFLHRHGILDAIPKGVRIPGIFRELEVGKSYLFREDRPKRCLEMLKEAINYGFKGLCFTMRYPPQKVRDEYRLEGVDIIWLKSKPEKGVKTLAPDKLDELEGVISEFIAPGGAVVMVDAFDQIKVVNGFEKSMEFLQKIKVATAESGTNLLISMRPESVWEEESAAIAKITKPHRSGPTWTSFELL